MKNILLFLFVISIGYSQTRTTTFQLPQWSTGDTLKSGTANDSSVSNFSLNNGFSRVDKILSKNIDSTGNFRHIRGTGTGNLEITAGAGGSSIGRIILNDSLYGTYNWQTTGNLLVGGNVYIGGFLSTDSIDAPLLLTDSLVSENRVFLKNGIEVGEAGTTNGVIEFQSELNSPVTIENSGVITSARTVTFKNADGEIAIDGSDTTAFSGSNTRLAVYRAGVTPASKVVAVPRIVDAGNGSEALPVAGDLLKVMVKTDSIIFLRAAGTTSGLKLTYTWLK